MLTISINCTHIHLVDSRVTISQENRPVCVCACVWGVQSRSIIQPSECVCVCMCVCVFDWIHKRYWRLSISHTPSQISVFMFAKLACRQIIVCVRVYRLFYIVYHSVYIIWIGYIQQKALIDKNKREDKTKQTSKQLPGRELWVRCECVSVCGTKNYLLWCIWLSFQSPECVWVWVCVCGRVCVGVCMEMY